jgi:hypothetical protein
VLAQIDSWEFNVFDCDCTSRGRPLFAVGFTVFERLAHILPDIDNETMMNFLTAVEAGYNDNPYHCNLHAADVVQSVYYFIARGGLAGFLRPIDVLALVIAAAVHDYGHLGVSNAFLVATAHPAALRYNDSSPAEANSVAKTFELLANPLTDVLSGFAPDERHYLRETIIELVIATDLKHHFSLMPRFQARLKAGAFDLITHQLPMDDRLLLMQFALKMADVGNPIKPLPLYHGWTDRCLAEFYLQGDAERCLGLPISASSDRFNPDPTLCQVNFINVIVHPLAEALFAALPLLQPLLAYPERNRACWENRDIERRAEWRARNIVTWPPQLPGTPSARTSLLSFEPRQPLSVAINTQFAWRDEVVDMGFDAAVLCRDNPIDSTIPGPPPGVAVPGCWVRYALQRGPREAITPALTAVRKLVTAQAHSETGASCFIGPGPYTSGLLELLADQARLALTELEATDFIVPSIDLLTRDETQPNEACADGTELSENDGVPDSPRPVFAHAEVAFLPAFAADMDHEVTEGDGCPTESDMSPDFTIPPLVR